MDPRIGNTNRLNGTNPTPGKTYSLPKQPGAVEAGSQVSIVGDANQWSGNLQVGERPEAKAQATNDRIGNYGAGMAAGGAFAALGVGIALFSNPVGWVFAAAGLAVMALTHFNKPKVEAAPPPPPAPAPAEQTKIVVKSETQVRHETVFNYLDKSGDGVLDEDELKERANPLLKFDPECDRGMTKDQALERMAQAEKEEAARRAKQAFKARDLDGNGKLEGDELQGKASAAELKQAHDADGDGMLNTEELVAAMKSQPDQRQALLKADKDGDMQLSAEEIGQSYLEDPNFNFSYDPAMYGSVSEAEFVDRATAGDPGLISEESVAEQTLEGKL